MRVSSWAGFSKELSRQTATDSMPRAGKDFTRRLASWTFIALSTVPSLRTLSSTSKRYLLGYQRLRELREDVIRGIAYLTADLQHVPKALRRNKGRPGAFPFDYGVDDERGAVDKLVELRHEAGDVFLQCPYALLHRVRRVLRRRKAFARPYLAGFVVQKDEVRERPADIAAQPVMLIILLHAAPPSFSFALSAASTFSGVMGRSLILTPIASYTAFAIAGAVGTRPGSPIPSPRTDHPSRPSRR